MKNKLLITLTIPLALATSSNLQAVTKARTLTQAAATYARNNKLKTTGIIIGGAIALDALQVGARWAYYQAKIKDPTKIKAADDALAKARGISIGKGLKYVDIFHLENSGVESEKQQVIKALAEARAAELNVDNATSAYNALLFHPNKASLICSGINKIIQKARLALKK